MSINKVYLPKIEKLTNFLEKNGSERFYFTYIKNREAFIGSNKSMKFINQFIDKYESTSADFKSI